MPVPNNVVRANIRATIGTNEELVHTLHFVRVNTATAAEPSLQEIADKVVEEWTEFLTAVINPHPTPASQLHTDLVYRTVDTYALAANGTATSQAQAVFGAAAKGTGTGVRAPNELACCVSLKTGFPGRSKRGRLFLGGFTTGAIAVGGLIQTTTLQGISAGLAKFGTDMKMQTGAQIDRLNWVVLSRTTTSVQRISEVRAGNLWDVQRRRQNGLTETFQTAAITY